MLKLDVDNPLALAVVDAIHAGDITALNRLLGENLGLASARIDDGHSLRSLLHVVTDWPGHFPRDSESVATLVAAGADVNARFRGSHTETPLHWAASSDDVEALDALLDAGADIDAPGGVIGGGSPLSDAMGFGQWKAARRLVERGAKTTLWQDAALGRIDRVESYFASQTPPTPNEVSHAFWYACHGGQLGIAQYLFRRGADLNWIPPWEERTPLDAARRQDARGVVEWLRSQDARSAKDLNS